MRAKQAQQARACGVLPKSILRGRGAGYPRLFKGGAQRGNLRFQTYKNRNIAGRQCSGQTVQVVPLAVIQQGVGRSAQQVANPLCHPTGLGALVGCGKEPQFSRERLRGQQWAALPLVVQKAAGHACGPEPESARRVLRCAFSLAAGGVAQGQHHSRPRTIAARPERHRYSKNSPDASAALPQRGRIAGAHIPGFPRPVRHAALVPAYGGARAAR